MICGRLDQQVFEDSGLYNEVLTFVQDFKEPFLAYLKALKPRRVAVNYSLNDHSADGITHGAFLYLESLLKEALPGVEIVSAEPIIGSLISQKAPLELAAIQEAVDITVQIFREICAFLKVGQTEKQVYDFIGSRMAERGLEPSFQTLVFAGDRGAGMGHGEATDNDIRPGDLVHVDMGVFVRGYASDMQRTWYVLRPGEDQAPEAARKGFRGHRGRRGGLPRSPEARDEGRGHRRHRPRNGHLRGFPRSTRTVWATRWAAMCTTAAPCWVPPGPDTRTPPSCPSRNTRSSRSNRRSRCPVSGPWALRRTPSSRPKAADSWPLPRESCGPQVGEEQGGGSRSNTGGATSTAFLLLSVKPFLAAAGSCSLFLLVSCGPSQAELQAQKWPRRNPASKWPSNRSRRPPRPLN